MLSKTTVQRPIPLNKNVKSLFVVCSYLPDNLYDIVDSLDEYNPEPSEKESIKSFLSNNVSDEEAFYIIEYKAISIKKADKITNYTITQTTEL